MTEQKRKLTPREIAARQLLEEQARLDAIVTAGRRLLIERDAHDAGPTGGAWAAFHEALDEYERGEK